jgi:hypothetical protein
MLWINRAGKQQATTHNKCFLNAKEKRGKGKGGGMYIKFTLINKHPHEHC